jgi:hypothetical protein
MTCCFHPYTGTVRLRLRRDEEDGMRGADYEGMMAGVAFMQHGPALRLQSQDLLHDPFGRRQMDT